MLLRSAEPGDELAVAEVSVRSWQVAYHGLLSQAYLDRLRPEDRAQRYTFGHAGPHIPATIVAVERGRICGFATTGPSRDANCPGDGELYAIYVDPAFWKAGIGRALIRRARRELIERNYTESILWVLVGNHRAERFYRLDGWIPDGTFRTAEAHGITVDEVRYRTSLLHPT